MNTRRIRAFRGGGDVLDRPEDLPEPAGPMSRVLVPRPAAKTSESSSRSRSEHFPGEPLGCSEGNDRGTRPPAAAADESWYPSGTAAADLHHFSRLPPHRIRQSCSRALRRGDLARMSECSRSGRQKGPVQIAPTKNCLSARIGGGTARVLREERTPKASRTHPRG